MSGSIDLNTNKGIALVFAFAGLVGGGASVLQNQIFGPGGEWQKVVTNQAVIQEQVKTFNENLGKLSNVLENGFQKVASSSEKQEDSLKEIQSQLDTYQLSLETLKIRMSNLEEFRKRLEMGSIP